MGKYIQRHRRPILGAACPIFFIFILVAIGLSVSPGWISRTYGTPGDSCKAPSSVAPCLDSNPDPLFFECDVCKGEFCVPFNDTTEDGRCGVVSSGTITTNTAAVSDQEFIPCPTKDDAPGCWTGCRQEFTDTNQVTPLGFNLCNSAVCEPSDDFCNGIAGGNQANACRSGTCQTESTPDPSNPLGCDYRLADGINCVLCESPAPASFDTCGNGICEPGQGEDCTTCPLDCLVPGFGGNCLSSSGGDICSTPKSCSANEEDLCCPSGCNPPDNGTCIAGDPNCDIDCLVPETCEEPGGGGLTPGPENGGCSLNRTDRGSPDIFAGMCAFGLTVIFYYALVGRRSRGASVSR